MLDPADRIAVAFIRAGNSTVLDLNATDEELLNNYPQARALGEAFHAVIVEEVARLADA